MTDVRLHLDTVEAALKSAVPYSDPRINAALSALSSLATELERLERENEVASANLESASASVCAAHRERDVAKAELERLEKATRTREDYDLRCDDCGAAHNLDCSIPSATWNLVAEPHNVLCVLCIDERLARAGIECDEAEFYFVGRALKSKMYAESHGDVAAAESERDVAIRERDAWKRRAVSAGRNEPEGEDTVIGISGRLAVAPSPASPSCADCSVAVRQAETAKELAERAEALTLVGHGVLEPVGAKQWADTAAKLLEELAALSGATADEKPCPHMRPSWRACPHCLGVNTTDYSTVSPHEPTDVEKT